MGVGAVALPLANPVAPAAAPHRGWTTRFAERGDRGRLRRYAQAMGWDLKPDGSLVGDIEGVIIRAYEDRDGASVVELEAPAVLPALEMLPRSAGPVADSDGMHEVTTGDEMFDRRFRLRAGQDWLALAVVDADVRRALLAAPEQTWWTDDVRLVAHSHTGLDPLDLLARATALRAVVQSVPWDAYVDRFTLPSQGAVQAVVRERKMRPTQSLPSVPPGG